MKFLKLAAAVTLVLGAAAPHLLGQATPTASRRGGLSVGAGFSTTSPDYAQRYAKGLSGWVDLDFTQHLSAEIMIHKDSIWTVTDIGEDTYMIGPRYTFHYKRLDPYIKVMLGYGVFQTQYDFRPHTSDSYFAYAGGAGLDYRLRPHINIRIIDAEAQRWPSFANNGGLSPYVYTFGGSYVF